MKVLSLCVYGDVEKYTIGAIKNAQMKNDYFPDWEMRLYCDNSLDIDSRNRLEKLDVNVINTQEQKDQIFYPRPEDSKTYGMFWRFVPASDEEVDYFISRDCDSRFSMREVHAVNEWIESDKPFHIIRDHPGGHAWVINGGMWGCKGGFIENIDKSIKEYLSISKWAHQQAADQWFLKECIYPVVKDYSLIHDEYFNYEGTAIPIGRDRKLDDFAFIGEPFDENDKPISNHRDMIIQRYI
jgi:hypothetical protein